MISASKKAEIEAFTKLLIDGVMQWYLMGEAVDCEETRRNMNQDLDTVLPKVEAKFGLRKIPKVLRARSLGNGEFVVRLEDPNLN